MIKIKMPNGTILATDNPSVARSYIKYGGGVELEELENNSNNEPKPKRGRKPKAQNKE